MPKVVDCGPSRVEGNGKGQKTPKLWHKEFRAAASHGIMNQC